MHIPSSTYRIQLHRDFTFKDLDGIIDYLEALGVSTIYAAPIVQATPGSMHGYDAIDPHAINREIGTHEELKKLSLKLREKNMTWLQDIVPNHMAFNRLNFRLMDVLERADKSPFFQYFDIEWHHPSPKLHGKLGVPFLGNELQTCIERGEIKVSFSEKGFTVDYGDQSYPVSLTAYPVLFSEKNDSIDWQQFLLKADGITNYDLWKKCKRDFVYAILNDPKKNDLVQQIISSLNGDKNKLRQLLNGQYYVLSFWKDTEMEINYRRFFTVNELICLRMEDKAVFDDYHTFLHTLFKENIFQGLRIDHIDGLKNPGQYIRRLRQLFGAECYIIAEKILEANEDMPEHWPLQGTSGYEFLSYVSQLMTDRQGAKQITAFYQRIIPSLPAYKALVLRNKKLILEKYMAGEWNNLFHYFEDLRLASGFGKSRIKQALALVMISLPVYRIYPEHLPLGERETQVMEEAFQKAILIDGGFKPELDYLKELFTGKQTGEGTAHRVLLFLQRLMQFTGPLTAKGVEDTTFYIYNALISHDEVGDAPSTLGITISNFHMKMLARQQLSPLSLNATATHDTKRGEDARLRLNVLCEFPEEWQAHVLRWFTDNKPLRGCMDGAEVPVLNDEYYIYQAIAGGFPGDLHVTDEFIQRLQEYQKKVVREAKVNSDWAQPDTAYEEACLDFIRNILQPDSKFLKSFLPFIRKIIERANVYSLSQTLIKVTAPGIPDIYQGCELWDLSFVDPDNRRPVDFDKRGDFLKQIILKEKQAEKNGYDVLFDFLKQNRDQGIEKLFVTWKALNLRKHNLPLFTEGSYIPLTVAGKDTVAIGYARHFKKQWAMVIVPLGSIENKEYRFNGLSEDHILLPDDSPDQWKNVITGEIIQTQRKLLLDRCLKLFPVALLINV